MCALFSPEKSLQVGAVKGLMTGVVCVFFWGEGVVEIFLIC